MKRICWVVLLAAVFPPGPPALAAQGAPARPDSARVERLRGEVERRFGERVQRELRLTPDQATNLRATHERFAARRRGVMERQRDLRQALDDQMQPGVAANADSVRKLMDALQAGRAEMLRIEEEEDREMAGYLSPVQRARLQIMRQRFSERVQELRRERGRRGGRGGRERPGRAPTD